jgi:DNA modification methylase
VTHKNLLYYGDNLDVLRRPIAAESVDLVYLDPPFNSNADYNVLFKEHYGTSAASQIMAFEDTWRWDEVAAAQYHDVLQQGGELAKVRRAFFDILGAADMMAYRAMMAPRLAERLRVLRPTGSLYLHCDPTASHYLKLLLDAVSFRSEIIWKRSSAHSDAKQGRKIHGHIHDSVLFYTKSDTWTWNVQYTPYAAAYDASEYRHIDPKTGRR